MNYQIVNPWLKQRCVWFSWPHDNLIWDQDCIPAQKEFAQVVMCASMTAPVFVGVPKKDLARASFIIPHHINLEGIDNFPTSVGDERYKIAYNIHTQSLAFIGKTGQHPFSSLNSYISEVIDCEELQTPVGGFITDGNKFLIGLSDVWLNANCNLTLDNITKLITKFYGIQHVFWLESSKALPPLRLDSICSLRVLNNHLVFIYSAQETNEYVKTTTKKLNDILVENAKVLKYTIEVHQVPSIDNYEFLDNVINNSSRAFYAYPSYASVLPINERVLVPMYGTKRDNEVLALMQRIFSDLEVVGVEVTALSKGGMLWSSLALAIPALK